MVSVMARFPRNTPDPAQESQGDGYSKPMLQALSAVCVRSPDYGTRSVSFLSTFHSDACFPPRLFPAWGGELGSDHRERTVGSHNSPVESILHAEGAKGESSAWCVFRYRVFFSQKVNVFWYTVCSFVLQVVLCLRLRLCSKLVLIHDSFSYIH